MIKKILKKLDKSLLLIMKLTLYLILMALFFWIMSFENRPLLVLSRTMGSTILTFTIVGALFLRIYGTYDIGRRKSKPIIYSLVLAVIFTDIVTYLELMIMNTITPDIGAFRLTSIEWLLLTIVVQIAVIILYTYAGNALYFYAHDPEPCCIIASDRKSVV